MFIIHRTSTSQMLCAGTAALAKCDATRDCLSARPKMHLQYLVLPCHLAAASTCSLVLLEMFASQEPGRHTSYRCNLLTSLLQQRLICIPARPALFVTEVTQTPTKGLKHKPHPMSYHTIVENIWLGMSYLGPRTLNLGQPRVIPGLDRQQISLPLFSSRPADPVQLSS